MTPEGKVKESVKHFLKSINAWFYMPVSLGMGRHGVPDFICMVNGRSFFVETKAPKKHLTGLQDRERLDIIAHGGLYFLVRDAADIEYMRSVLV